MKKLAIFVEGLTERLFAEALLRQVVDAKKLNIEVYQATGGRTTPRRLTLISKTAASAEQIYYIQIVESCNDSRVGSDVRDRYSDLVRAGFQSIIAIRDVYPECVHADIPTLRRALAYRLPTKPILVTFILGVMEVESWFLAEHTHYPKIHANLTVPRIMTTFGFDPSTDDICTASRTTAVGISLARTHLVASTLYHVRMKRATRTTRPAPHLSGNSPRRYAGVG